MFMLNLTYFLLITFLKKIPFEGTNRFLLKYGFLELYWLYSEGWNIFIRYACYQLVLESG